MVDWANLSNKVLADLVSVFHWFLCEHNQMDYAIIIPQTHLLVTGKQWSSEVVMWHSSESCWCSCGCCHRIWGHSAADTLGTQHCTWTLRVSIFA